ncbi:MAG: hypothetical protein H6Q52_979 [Deltaproteobacteria bacterium]|nr:hypothetical protein [Deltaproteobacteria bacterium]
MPEPHDKPQRFEIKEEETQLFALLFQHGVCIRCTTGVTIEELLVAHFGIAREYLEKKLTTVFLNGAPVDDISEVPISDGMALALSSSMPGLAGATLRRQGMLSSMRRSITYHHEGGHPASARAGFITIKLFNILAGEMGPILMKHGICIEALELAGFIGLSPKKARLVSAMSKNKAKDPEEFIHMLEQYGTRKVEIITGC